MHDSLGSLIRTLRKKAGLTQEQLSFGICSPVSISRIETGHQNPSKVLLDALLERLGSDAYHLCGTYFRSGLADDLHTRFVAIKRGLEHDSLIGIEEQIADLECASVSQPGYDQKCLFLRAEASRRMKRSEEAVRQFEQALRLSKPNIRVDDFRHELLSVIEADVLLHFAMALADSGRLFEASSVYAELDRSIGNLRGPLSDYKTLRVHVDVNWADTLYRLKRYEDSNDMIERAEALSYSSSNESSLPEIQFLKARMLADHGLAQSEGLFELPNGLLASLHSSTCAPRQVDE